MHEYIWERNFNKLNDKNYFGLCCLGRLIDNLQISSFELERSSDRQCLYLSMMINGENQNSMLAFRIRIFLCIFKCICRWLFYHVLNMKHFNQNQDQFYWVNLINLVYAFWVNRLLSYPFSNSLELVRKFMLTINFLILTWCLNPWEFIDYSIYQMTIADIIIFCTAMFPLLVA